MDMKKYANRRGTSRVEWYGITPDCIEVLFVDGHRFTYSNESVGQSNVAFMKALAVSGKGLYTFIMKHINKGYDP